MPASSALTAALSSADGDVQSSRSLAHSGESVLSGGISSSAFPCLYQHEGCADDTFEVDLDFEKLTLGGNSSRWRDRRSVELRRSVDRRGSLDEPQISDNQDQPRGGLRLQGSKVKEHRHRLPHVAETDQNEAIEIMDKAATLWLQDESQRWEKLGSPQLVSKFMSPGSLGSAFGAALPKPMAQSARRAAGLETPSPSPHILSFKDIQPGQLSARTADGRRLRRRVLRGTVLVCIVAGYHGKRFIYERAHELGVRLVIVDSKESWAKDLAQEGIVSKFVDIDFSDESLVFDKCLAVIRDVEKEFGRVDGVISFWELSQPLVARIAEQLGLPGNPPDAVDNARDKQRTRDVMKAAGLPTPRNMPVASPNDLRAAADAVGFPAVIKPTSGAASLGVIKVESLDDLERVYSRVCKEVASVRETSDGRWQTDIDDGAEVVEEEGTGAKFIAQTFIMEQYLNGPEVDIDLVMSGGEAVYGGVTDNWPTVEPYFNETGSNSPSTLPTEQQRALCELGVASAKALGFQTGVLHVEGKFTSHGPHLIEINARMGGGPVRLMNQLVWGVDLVEEQLLASAGVPSRPYLARRPDKHVAEYSVNAPRSGVMRHTDFLEEWQRREDVVYCRPLVDEGERVTAIEDGMPTWIYEVLVTRPTIDAAIEFVKKIEEAVAPHVPIEPAAAPPARAGQ